MTTQYEDDLAKVKQNGFALEHVNNQTPELCLAAVKQNGYVLQYIDEKISDKLDPENPEHKRFYDLGWRDGDLTQIYLEAIKQNGWALQFIKEQTPELLLSCGAKKTICFTIY